MHVFRCVKYLELSSSPHARVDYSNMWTSGVGLPSSVVEAPSIRAGYDEDYKDYRRNICISWYLISKGIDRGSPVLAARSPLD